MNTENSRKKGSRLCVCVRLRARVCVYVCVSNRTACQHTKLTVQKRKNIEKSRKKKVQGCVYVYRCMCRSRPVLLLMAMTPSVRYIRWVGWGGIAELGSGRTVYKLLQDAAALIREFIKIKVTLKKLRLRSQREKSSTRWRGGSVASTTLV